MKTFFLFFSNNERDLGPRILKINPNLCLKKSYIHNYMSKQIQAVERKHFSSFFSNSFLNLGPQSSLCLYNRFLCTKYGHCMCMPKLPWNGNILLLFLVTMTLTCSLITTFVFITATSMTRLVTVCLSTLQKRYIYFFIYINKYL